MPIHFEDLDFVAEVQGLRSALIVPCRMCPAATVAVREDRPFLTPLTSPFRSRPFERYLEALRGRLADEGIQSEVFDCRFYHQWFMCMWTTGTRNRLMEQARKHDALIVLGCSSATMTVRDTVESLGCTVVEGMKATGIMNARLTVRWPGHVSFRECKEAPLLQSEH